MATNPITLWQVLIMPCNEYKAWRNTSAAVFSTPEKALKFVKEYFASRKDYDEEDNENSEEWTMDNYRNFIPDEFYTNIDKTSIDIEDSN